MSCNCSNKCAACEFIANKTDDEKKILSEVVAKIWDIAKISPEHGNMLMDVLGDDTYQMVAKINSKLN